MSDTDFVSDRVENLAKYLKEHLGATGSGLGAAARNVRQKLPPTLYTGLMHMAFIRNKVAYI